MRKSVISPEQYAEVTRERDHFRRLSEEYERRGRAWEQRARALKDELDRVRADGQSQVAQLVNKLVDLANRPPVIIQATDTIREVGELVATVTGMKMTDGGDGRVMVPGVTGMDALGLTPTGTNGDREWYPAHEFDASLEDQSQWPTRGGWYNPNPQMNGQQQTAMMTGHRMAEGANGEGKVERADGQPMFQAGMGAEPPVGGVE